MGRGDAEKDGGWGMNDKGWRQGKGLIRIIGVGVGVGVGMMADDGGWAEWRTALRAEWRAE
jgi:hypothetical protein